MIGQQARITEAGYQAQLQAYQNMIGAANAAESAEKTAATGELISSGFKLAAAFATP